MKKLIKYLLVFILFLSVLSIAGFFYLSHGKTGADKTVWETYLGHRTDTGILPDRYANYFTYTVARTNKDIGFRIKGSFPDTRYMSYNVYSLGDNITQGSLIDYQIETDSGKSNPFLSSENKRVDKDNNYTVHVVPEKYKQKKLSNLLAFRNDVKLLSIVIRLYDYNINDTGGVELPTVEAFTLDADSQSIELSPTRLPRSLNLRFLVEGFSLPKMVERLSHLYATENQTKIKSFNSNKEYTSLSFHAIDDSGFIENNDNRYLLSAITKKPNEVYVFKFKSPSYTTGPENINLTDMRYWSFNLGDAESFNFNGLKDEDANIDENAYVTIVLADNDPEITQLTAELNYNFMEWNMQSQEALIHFRHMLANPDFEAQIDNVPPIKEGLTDYSSLEAQNFMGEYSPTGYRLSKQEFLTDFALQKKPE